MAGMTNLLRHRLIGDAVALAAPLLVGGVGGAITIDRIPTWYRSLDKPSWNPPDAVFGPVWTTLYVLMGIAMIVVRRTQADADDIRRAEALNGIQLALNLSWTLVFFGAKDVRSGAAAIALLWLSIVATTVAFARVNRRAGLMLLPYLGWVTFASALNIRIWHLNRD